VLKHLPMILKNCWRNRRRTILTILSIGVSLCLLGVLLAIYHAFYFSDPTPAQALRLITRNSISLARPMPQAYANNIKRVAGVREVAIEDWFGGQYIDDRPEHNFARFAVDADKEYASPAWPGVLPFKWTPGEPVPDPRGKADIPVPANIARYTRPQ